MKTASTKQIKDHAKAKNKAATSNKSAAVKAGVYSIDDEGNFTKNGVLICQVIFQDYGTVKDMQRICDTLNECDSN